MKLTHSKSLLALGLIAASLLPAAATEPNADQLLQQMSAKLAATRSFSFEANRLIDPVLVKGLNLPENAHLVLTVLRPNKIAAESTSKGEVRHFYADGQNLSLVDVTKNLYATVPMHTSIDGLVAELDQKYGFTPALAELALSDIYQDIRGKAQSVAYLGEGTDSGGSACHRLALPGKIIDAELWVGVSDQLPKRLITTLKNRPGKPQIKLDFSNWNLAAKTTDNNFAFVPSKGAVKVPMIATAEMEAAQKTNNVTQN